MIFHAEDTAPRFVRWINASTDDVGFALAAAPGLKPVLILIGRYADADVKHMAFLMQMACNTGSPREVVGAYVFDPTRGTNKPVQKIRYSLDGRRFIVYGLDVAATAEIEWIGDQVELTGALA